MSVRAVQSQAVRAASVAAVQRRLMGRSREPTRILQAGVQNKRSPLPCPAGHRGAETHRAKAGVVLCPTVGGDDLADLFNVHLVVGIALERTLVKVGEHLVA